MISFFDTGMQIQYLVPSYENTSVFFEEKNRLKIGATLNYHQLGTKKENLFLKNVETNEDNFERNLEKYNIGSISSIEFRRAQLNLLNANLEYNSAKYQTKLSEAFFL